MTRFERIQQAIWHLIYPLFPHIQKSVHFLHGKERQRYHLGWLAEGRTITELKTCLAKQGFGNHFIAWIDPGQVLSWRRLESFKHQYHIRVFFDGEIRGHFELTPEAHPIKHFKEIGEEARTEEFKKFLGDFLSTERCTQSISTQEAACVPNRQITYRDTLAPRSS